MSIILLTLEILYRAALILGVIYALDIAHNGKIDLYHPKIRRLKKGIVYRFFMKIADKLESSLEARKRAWEFRVRRRKRRSRPASETLRKSRRASAKAASSSYPATLNMLERRKCGEQKNALSRIEHEAYFEEIETINHNQQICDYNLTFLRERSPFQRDCVRAQF